MHINMPTRPAFETPTPTLKCTHSHIFINTNTHKYYMNTQPRQPTHREKVLQVKNSHWMLLTMMLLSVCLFVSSLLLQLFSLYILFVFVNTISCNVAVLLLSQFIFLTTATTTTLNGIFQHFYFLTT